MSELEKSIDRMTNWKFEQQHLWRDQFIRDLANVLEAAAKMIPATNGTIDLSTDNVLGQISLCDLAERYPPPHAWYSESFTVRPFHQSVTGQD